MISREFLIESFCECFEFKTNELQNEFNIRMRRREYCAKKHYYYVGEFKWKKYIHLNDKNYKEDPNEYKSLILNDDIVNLIDQLWFRTIIIPTSRKYSGVYNYIENKLSTYSDESYLDFGGGFGLEPLQVHKNFETVYLAEIDKSGIRFAKFLAEKLSIDNFKVIFSDKPKFLKRKHFDVISAIYSLECFTYEDAKKMLVYMLKHCDEFFGYWTMEETNRLRLGIESANKAKMKHERILFLPRVYSLDHIINK